MSENNEEIPTPTHTCEETKHQQQQQQLNPSHYKLINAVPYKHQGKCTLIAFADADAGKDAQLEETKHGDNLQLEDERSDSERTEDTPLTEAEKLGKYSSKRVFKSAYKKKSPLVAYRDKVRQKQTLINKVPYPITLVYQKYPTEKLGASKIDIIVHPESLQGKSDVYEIMRAYFSELLVNHSDFNLELFQKSGGLFNTLFWEINVNWIDPTLTSITDRLDLITHILQSKQNNCNC